LKNGSFIWNIYGKSEAFDYFQVLSTVCNFKFIENKPAAKWRGEDFRPAVSFEFTLWQFTSFFTLFKSPFLHASKKNQAILIFIDMIFGVAIKWWVCSMFLLSSKACHIIHDILNNRFSPLFSKFSFTLRSYEKYEIWRWRQLGSNTFKFCHCL
jgi:hypothetical protein